MSSLTEAIKRSFNYYFKRINTNILVEVVGIEGNRVQLQPLINGKRQLDTGEVVNYKQPIILDVPVLTLQAGGFSVRMPISVGDQGLAIISQRDISEWKKSEKISNQGSLRRFDLNDSFYLGAIMPKSESLATDGVYIYNDAGLYFSVKSDKVETNMDIHCQQVFCTNVFASGNISGAEVITPSVASYNSHTHSGVQSGSSDTGVPS